jgi:hypothetical protein
LHILLARRIGKIDARNRRRVEASPRRNALGRVPCMRRTRSSVRGIPGSAAVLCRRTNPMRATTGATSAARPGETHCTQPIAGRCINRACSCRARCFRNALLCSAAPRQSAPTTTEAGPALRRSHWSAPVRRRASGRATQNPQQSRGYNTACIECGRSNVSRQRWHGASQAGSEHKFPVRWRRVVEPALYPVEGRQAGGLRQKFGTALIRKANCPRDRVKGRPFCRVQNQTAPR